MLGSKKADRAPKRWTETQRLQTKGKFHFPELDPQRKRKRADIQNSAACRFAKMWAGWCFCRPRKQLNSASSLNRAHDRVTAIPKRPPLVEFSGSLVSGLFSICWQASFPARILS